MKDILDNNDNFLNHIELTSKYKLITNFIECLQLKSCIPREWKDWISKVKISASKIPDGNCIEINNKYINIDKIQCKDFYWHLIEKYLHNPKCKKAWIKEFPDIESVNNNIWKRIFNLPFSTKDTNVQSFQFRIIHKLIFCNKWLYTIKIKNNALCNFCDDDDDILIIFINCVKVKAFWELLD